MLVLIINESVRVGIIGFLMLENNKSIRETVIRGHERVFDETFDIVVKTFR